MAAPVSDPMQTDVAGSQDPQSSLNNAQNTGIASSAPLGLPSEAPTPDLNSGGASPAQVAPPTQAPIIRTATPTRALNGIGEVPPPVPAKATSHGAPTRRYLNERVTGVLLEGMKKLAAEQPEAPLKVLGEYLLQRSEEIERKAAAT